MTTKEMIDTLRYKANNIKAKIESDFFFEVADRLEKQTWISVKDRLPERRQLVLIQKKYRINNIYYALGWYQDNEWYINFEKIEDNEVLAWMPLPKAYKIEK
jgi:hypothetical protein